MGTFKRQLKVMLRKNWLLKIRHPFLTASEIFLPTVVMLMLIAVRTQVDTELHPVQPNIQKETFVEVGKGNISPSFEQVLESLLANHEYLAFVPDTDETQMMINVLSAKFPVMSEMCIHFNERLKLLDHIPRDCVWHLKSNRDMRMVSKIYKDEYELETYIQSNNYGSCNASKSCLNPKIKGAIVFHNQGPEVFDYSIRLNHSWAFSGFPDVKTIMDVNGPYLNDLELGVNSIPILQYSFSGFFTLQQVVDSFIIFAAQQNALEVDANAEAVFLQNILWRQYSPATIRVIPFPTREYTDNEFQSIIKKVMGVLYLLGFLYPVSRLISYSVSEKEQKIKEGLYMMGLKDEIFYLSWFITYALQFAISSGIITICTMTTLFQYSDKSLVFVYFFTFGLSAIMLSFLISTCFTRSKTAVAVGTLSFLGAYFPYYTVNDQGGPMSLKVTASLLSPTAFALGSVNFADYERAHVGLRWSNMWQSSSGVNFFVCLLMMVFDTLLYCAIGLYLDKVIPRENGSQHRWYFIFSKCFHRHRPATKASTCYSDDSDGMPSFVKSDVVEVAIEAVTLEMKQQELDSRCIQIRNLQKVYSTKKGMCAAVKSLQLNLYENQILALLGHNGAGKSTTISMLVGLLRPTFGDALVLGKNIMTEMEEIRKLLGVCPQTDILFSELTVKEHLELFANLKGVKEEMLESSVITMIEEVGLADKVNTHVGALSGGMKRKLSLGIALIGDSKVIVLDEPTSGMDPYSMRLTWQLIKKMKKGRIILLTTHSMDEADALGDRIAIMANGSLKCCGSSLFLKHHYGVGYTLTLVKGAPSASIAADIVYRHIPSAACVSEVGTEISFKLPLTSSSSFESMFREIEGFMKKSNPTSGVSENEGSHSQVIESYGISVTTLEEVFLRVAGSDINEIETSEEKKISISPNPMLCHVSSTHTPKGIVSSKLCGSYMKVVRVILDIVWKACSLSFASMMNFLRFLSMQCCCLGILSGSTFWQHCRALFIKRAISASRDRKTIVFQLLFPAIFLLLGLIFVALKPHPAQQSITLTTSYFNPLLSGGGGGGPIPVDLSKPISTEVVTYIEGGWVQRYKPATYQFPHQEEALSEAIEAAGQTLGPDLLSMSEYLMSSFNESYQSRYGAVVFDDQNSDGSLGYTVLHNSSCQHAAPTYINLVNAAILRLATMNKNMTIQTRNHPLPLTTSQHVQRHDLDAFAAVIIINIAFSFIPASFAVAIVKECEVKAKHQQLISGVSVWSYWISTYIWDFVSFLFPTSFALILFYMFGLDQFIGTRSFFPTTIIFLEYGLAIASSTYCLTFFFSEHTMAQNVVLLVHFFTGLVLMAISFVMGLIETTASLNSSLKNFFRLSPGFCFADGLASLALLRQGMKTESSDKVLDWNVTGASICYLGVEAIIYFLFALALELVPPGRISLFTYKECWKSIIKIFQKTSDPYLEPLLEGSSKSASINMDEDVDVKAERNRVLSGSADNAILYLRNLRKEYPGAYYSGIKVAVQSLTFSVQEGECFGFLGTNGAGKTTTLSMLTGEERPSSGTAFVFSKNICSNPKAVRRHIGYCPQFDALLEFLTVQEHLELYARIKGVTEYGLKNVVTEKLIEFDLLKHANKPSFSLSGGNKRKLSVAIAMIGDPPIVILDEPSTGMDPIAKRFMWEVISRLSTRRGKTAVILTTHSMNEAQALCTRIGIMVGGRLRCIGSPQHLKSRFGNHFELELKPIDTTLEDLENLCQLIQERLFHIPSQPKGGLLSDLEVCIGANGNTAIETASMSEISLSEDTIVMIGRWLGNEKRVLELVSSTKISQSSFGEQLSDQLFRDGGIPLPVFSEWWLAKDKFSAIDSFVLSSFPGATSQGCNGLSIKYQLPYAEELSLADVFGHIERNRDLLGIADYSISQSTLESIFNHFAANAS